MDKDKASFVLEILDFCQLRLGSIKKQKYKGSPKRCGIFLKQPLKCCQVHNIAADSREI